MPRLFLFHSQLFPMPAQDELIDVNTAAEILDRTGRAIRMRCARGTLDGAFKLTGRWIIPREAVEKAKEDE